MTYSCAIFSRGATTLEEAQEAKHELICQKLGLKRGQRVLDVGCGWGAFAIHAAQRHGVARHRASRSRRRRSRPRAGSPRRRASPTASTSASPTTASSPASRFDAVASIGMVEHVGAEQMDEYARRLRGALRPGGTLLNHGIANLQPGGPEAGRVLRALRVPRRRAAAALARAARARARGLRDAPHRGLPRRLRRDAAPLGAPRSTRTSTRRCGWRAPSACACGGCTCARRATASRPASRRSTRSARRDRRGARARAPRRGVESEHRVAWARRTRRRTDGLGPAGLRPLGGQAVPGAGRRCAPACPSASASAPTTSRSRAPRTAAATSTSLRVREMLARRRRAEADLACGPAEPRDPRGRDRVSRGRRAARAGAPQLLGQARLRDRARERRGLAGRGLLRRRAPAAGGDVAGVAEATGLEPARAPARHRRLRDATFSVPLARLADAFGRLAGGGLGAGGRPAGGGDDRAPRARRLSTARSTPS